MLDIGPGAQARSHHDAPHPRLDRPAYLPDLLPPLFGILGVGLALVTAWLDGELVFRLGVAVDRDANLDASSSLEREGVLDVEA